ncbi:hypothetical protein JW911_02295 [Candidatus Peregrinibacteria bacterium]|nr:hypothetical protein [Candidatus Peregrinibacteria bacterium]
MEYLSYLFSPIPGAAFNYTLWIIIYGSALILAAILLKVFFSMNKNNKALKRTFRSAPGQLVWCGISIIMLALSRSSGIPYLSMRFFLFAVIALSIYYIIKNILKIFYTYPKMKDLVEKPESHTAKKVYTTKKK